MIYIDFLTVPDGRLMGFRIAGHAEYDGSGNDIVCASVSSVAYFAVNTVTDVLKVTPLALRVDEGEMFFRTQERDEPLCRTIFAGLKLHLTELEDQYPQCLKVNYLEI